MAEQPTRKLAVLLRADVVGSTALVKLNETLAHQRIQDTFRRFSETISSHSGVAHEIRGDALVAEFARASDAVSASDGITEDIITELSRFKTIAVIARNSSFTFKGQAVDVKDVGQKLGVDHIVEGSVRKAGNRVRVTAQLIEVVSGNHLWAERYDRDLHAL